MNLSLSDDKKFLVINSCTEHEYNQLVLSLTKKIDGWRFHPLVKKKLWNGEISFIKRNKIPSGLWKEVIDICKDHDIKVSIKGVTDIFDTTISEESFYQWATEFFADSKIKPRDYQLDAAFKILKFRRCLGELATSAGKTLISYIIISYLFTVLNKKRILFIVPNVSLVLQATGDFDEYNNLDKVSLKIQQIYAGVKIKKSSNIVIGTYQSLTKKSADYFSEFDVVMVDETHKAKSKSIQDIMDNCWHCDYRFGLSGTIPKRGTVDRLGLMSAMGPLVVQVKANYLQNEGHISQCKVLQLNLDYATQDEKVAFYELSKNYQDRQKLFTLEKNFINTNQKRLDIVSGIINKAASNSLVLFHKIEYGEALYNKLRKITKTKQIYYVDGSIDSKIREEIKAKMENNNDIIIVASYGTFSTGISIKRIHNIFFTESFKSDVIIKQSIGRGLRKHDSKTHVKIYDFIDDFRVNVDGKEYLNYIYKHGIERRVIYKDEKFEYEIQTLKF